MSVLGPMVGHTTYDHARIWIRSSDPPARAVVVPHDGAFEVEALGREVYLVKLRGLSPKTRYTVTIVNATGAGLGTVTVRTQSFTPPEVTRLLFGSCQRASQPTRIWDTMYKRHLVRPADALLLIGDQSYADEGSEFPDQKLPWDEPDLERLEAAYEALYDRAWSKSHPARVMSQIPTYMTWDDHDIFDDWGSDPAKRLTHPDAANRYPVIEGVYRRYQRSRGPDGPSLDFGVRFGPVAVYMMDLRSVRGVDPQAAIVGRAQHARLRAWLTTLDPAVRLVVVACSVPLTFVNNRTIRMGIEMGLDVVNDLADQWNYPGNPAMNLHDNRPELARMLDTLFAAQIPGKRQVVAVGGDVHCGYGHKIVHEPSQKRIYSFTTSAVACAAIADSERKLVKNGVRYKNTELAAGYRGSWLGDVLEWGFNYGELTYELGTRAFGFSLVTEDGVAREVFRGTV